METRKASSESASASMSLASRLTAARIIEKRREQAPLQANVLLYGDGGNAKTSFALLHCPQPVLNINCDRRDGPALERARRLRRDVERVEFYLPTRINRTEIGEAKRKAKPLLERLERTIEWAVDESKKGNIGTIAIDTANEVSGIVSAAHCGRTQSPKNDYGVTKGLVNQFWWDVFGLAREGKAHLIVLSRAKAIWKDNKPTGFFAYRCPSVVNDACDWAGNIRLKTTKTGRPLKDFEIMITKSGGDLTEIGEVYDEDDWEEYGPFAFICSKQWKKSAVEDWMD